MRNHHAHKPPYTAAWQDNPAIPSHFTLDRLRELAPLAPFFNANHHQLCHTCGRLIELGHTVFRSQGHDKPTILTCWECATGIMIALGLWTEDYARSIPFVGLPPTAMPKTGQALAASRLHA